MDLISEYFTFAVIISVFRVDVTIGCVVIVNGNTAVSGDDVCLSVCDVRP